MSDEKKVNPITRVNFGVAESKRTVHAAIVQAGLTIEDIMTTNYFANVIKDITVFDRIEARAEDGKWWAELLVVYCNSGALKLKLINGVKIQETKKEDDVQLDGHVVKWGNMHTKYRVIRDADKEVIKEGFETKGEAVTWAQQHVRQLAA